MHHALIIDDDEDYRNLLARKLGRLFPGLAVTEIDPRRDGLPGDDYTFDTIDFIILDYQLGIDSTGLDWYKRYRPEAMPATILLTAKGSETLAVRAIKLGIDDYIVKEKFDDEALDTSINECIYHKKLERARMLDLKTRSEVFNKTTFIQRLKTITADAAADSHLLVFNPAGYERIGREKGLSSQDNYIHHLAQEIYRYFSSNHIGCSIFIYREEYIAVIVDTKTYQTHLMVLYDRLEVETYRVGGRDFPCAVSVGVISPRSLEEREFSKSDFELLGIAQVLCEAARSGGRKRICQYGDVKIKEVGEELRGQGREPFDIEETIGDGRISANYQPWIYIATDESISLKDIYDVRVEVIDTTGRRIGQDELLMMLDDAYARRIVDRWVIRNTVTQLKELSRDGDSKIKFAVRVSLSTVSDPKFPPWLRVLLKDANPPRGCLLFEIDAAHFLRDPAEYQGLIKEFGDLYDVKFILSGVSRIELYYEVREKQRFDYIKLNVKDLIYGFPRGPLNRLIATVKEDSGKIVAINVADAETLTLATDFDIDYVHGYLVGRPFVDVITDSEGDLYCVI